MGHERSSPKTLHPLAARGTALRPAPHPRSSAQWPPPRSASASANRMRTALGGDWANPLTVPGVLQFVPARGSIVGLLGKGQVACEYLALTRVAARWWRGTAGWGCGRLRRSSRPHYRQRTRHISEDAGICSDNPQREAICLGSVILRWRGIGRNQWAKDIGGDAVPMKNCEPRN